MTIYKPYLNYKDSNVEWIGEIPSEWELIKLKYLVKINTGSADTQDKVENGDYPFFVRSSVVERINYFTNDEKAILTAGDGAGVGKVFHYYEGKFTAHQRVYIFKEFKQINAKYLFYYLKRNLAFEVLMGEAKSTVDSIRREMLTNFPVALPSLEYQDKVALYLNENIDRVEGILKQKLSLIELLKEKRQAVITEAVTKGLDPNVPMKDSGVEWIGEVPAHWEVDRMKRHFQIKKVIEGKKNPTILSMTQRGIKVRDISTNEGQIAENYDKYQTVNVGDFVMNHMDLLTGYVDYSSLEGVTSPDYRVFRIKDSAKGDSLYFLYYFQKCYFNRIFYGHGQGVSKLGRWRLPTDAFLNFMLPIPPLEEQMKIQKYLDEILLLNEKTRVILAKQITKLKEYRESLIYEAVTGKIDLRDYKGGEYDGD